jgi:GntR family transcriptional regulator
MKTQPFDRYLEAGQPMELAHSYCRSDYYGFVAEMRRAP